MNGELNLLVEWSSPWEEFKSSVRPAMMRSPERLAGEARTGLFPYRGMVMTWTGEAALFALFLLLMRGYDSMRPYQPPTQPKYDVIYYSGEELPRLEDQGGAQSGRSGRGGGQEAHHPTQTIRVARGETLREKVVDAPRLNLPHSDAAVANLLAYKPVPGPPPSEGIRSSLRAPVLPQNEAIAPAPDVQRDRLQAAPAMAENVVPPAPDMQRDKLQAAPSLSASVVPPAPSAQNLTPLRVPGSHAVQVVPPPVSAPVQMATTNPRLALPAQSVVAPPPTQVTRDMAKIGPGLGSGELQKQVVPPPVQMGNATGANRTAGGLGSAAVVPPPVQMSSSNVTSRGGVAGGLGNSSVVPPPVQMEAGSLAHQPVSGLGGGLGVVPPPPSLSGGSSLEGRGRGSKGLGLGGPGEMGEVAAPPAGGGNAVGTGVVVSNQPGSRVGLPGGGGQGSLAMSPQGNASTGYGGSGGGSSIGRGTGPGSGLAGDGPGAGRSGSGKGSDPTARAGLSPYPGPGGTGSGGGNSAMPGVSVRGGTSSVVNLPSFAEGGSLPTDPTRSSAGADRRPSLTIEASPRSGGALNMYGALKGDKVYTIYIDTVLGTAVMEYADPSSAQHGYGQSLAAPEPMRADLPAGIKRSRLVIACVVDRAGVVRNPQILETDGREMAAKVLAALPTWKFRPALRGNQPVEVNAILGFGIDTRDRY